MTNKPNTFSNRSRVMRAVHAPIAVVVTLISAVLAVLGLFFLYIGAAANPPVALFGRSWQHTVVGVVSILLSVFTARLVVRMTKLDSYDA